MCLVDCLSCRATKAHCLRSSFAFSGIVVPAERTLWDCGIRVGDHVVGEVTVDETQTSHEYVMPRLITIAVKDELTGAVLQELDVEVSRDPEWANKPYLGGFRHKGTGVLYHHAATQTAGEVKKRFAGAQQKYSRETQTAAFVARSTQTLREASTQMTRRDLYVDGRGDVVRTPGAYFSADALDVVREEKVLHIQCAWRCHVARGKAAAALREREAHAQEAAALEAAAAEAAAAEAAEAQRRRTQPRSKQDFAALYNEVEAWRASETARIDADYEMSTQEKAIARARLLAKETRMLQAIGRLKGDAAVANKGERVQKMLDAMASAKKWEMSDGEVAAIHTPFTSRAKELADLYRGLGLPVTATPTVEAAASAAGASESKSPAVLAGSASALTVDERLDVLLHVKWTVQEFDCKLTREVVSLIDREADMLDRGRAPSSMKGLRKRLQGLFLQFVETPEFNPEAARFQRVPRSLDERPLVKPIVKKTYGDKYLDLA